jgi:hypothetical protein
MYCGHVTHNRFGGIMKFGSETEQVEALQMSHRFARGGWLRIFRVFYYMRLPLCYGSLKRRFAHDPRHIAACTTVP